jgi:4-carboxymuconolactone decarboxylase
MLFQTGGYMSEKYKKGAAVFKEVIGWEPPETGPDFLKITVENLFADVWGREGLSIRDRRLITITMLTMMLKEDSLKGHLEQALKKDLSKKEISEMMIHIAHYAGWPVGQFGFEVAGKVIQAQKAPPKQEE